MNGALSPRLDTGAPGAGAWDPDLSTTCLLQQEKKKKREGKKKKKKQQRRVAPYCRITFQLAESIFQMFWLSCSLFLHSDLIWPRWKMMWRGFLFCTWHPYGRQRGSLIPNSSKVKAPGTKIFWKQPRKNFRPGPCVPRKNRTVNCYPFCRY